MTNLTQYQEQLDQGIFDSGENQIAGAGLETGDVTGQGGDAQDEKRAHRVMTIALIVSVGLIVLISICFGLANLSF